MKPPIHNNNKTKKCPGQQKKHPEKKSSSRKSPKSVRCRSKFSRSELFAKRDIIHNSPYCPDIIKNISSPAAVLCWFVLQSVLRHCKRDSCLSRNQVQMSMVELGNRAGVSLRATQMGVGCLCDNGVYAVDQVKQTGHLSWRNDPRGNIFTLLLDNPPVRAPLFSTKINKKISVVENNSPEPDFEKKRSPGLEFELATLPQNLGFGKIKERALHFLDLSTQPALRNQRIREILYRITDTAETKELYDELNDLLIQGLRMDKEDMLKGERPKALMALFSVDAKLKTATGGIRYPAAYLLGILKKPRAEQRGCQSLAATVMSMPDPGFVDDKIQRAIDPATMHDGVFVRSQQLFKQIEPWRPMPESKKELVGRFNAFWGEIMGDCHPMAKKDLTDRHGKWAIPIVLSVRLSNLLRKKDGSAPIRSEVAYVKTLSKKDSLDNPLPYVDAVLAKAGVDLVVAGIQTAATKTNESPGSERCRRARAPEQNFPARKFPPSAIGDFFEAAATHQPLDVDEMKKFSAKIKTAVSEVKEKREP